jgi:hypothetical protein
MTGSRIRHVLNSKEFHLTVISILLFGALKNPIEELLTNTIVELVFDKIQSTLFNDVIFCISAIYILILFISKPKSYIPSSRFVTISLLIAIVYSIYRIQDSVWSFTQFKSLPLIKYADILFVVAVYHILLISTKKSKPKETGVDSFFEDKPIGPKGIDKLGYKNYAENLSAKIQSSHFESSFAIGINGKWGLGKTSFIDLLKSKLKDPDIIEINFNPWSSQSHEVMIKDFFDSVQEKIRPHHSNASRLLIKYSDKLIDVNKNNLTESIKALVSSLTGFESSDQLYGGINDALKKINKKLIIYIDDLDRLSPNEIIEVIRLIRNTANFYNTFFIVAYDRNYVIKALTQHNQYNQEQFLEKIFQLEITLPHFDKNALTSELAEKLKTKFPEKLHQEMSEDIIGSHYIIPSTLNEWLESMRDVTRLANTITLNLNKLVGEVIFNEFLMVELLRMKFPSVYELISRKTSDFLEVKESNNGKFKYTLKTKSKEIKFAAQIENENLILHDYLIKNHETLSISNNDISKISDLLRSIFPNPNTFYFRKDNDKLSITHPSKFHRYFQYKLLEGNLSEVEFSNARASTINKFKQKITQWVEIGLETELKISFLQIRDFDDREDFEKCITAIFHLANLPSKKEVEHENVLVSFDQKAFIENLPSLKEITRTYYPEENGDKVLEKFITRLFKNAKSPYLFESEFTRRVNSQFSDDFILSKKNANIFSLNYLKKYCASTNTLDNRVWNLFWNCSFIEWKDKGTSHLSRQEIIPQKAKDILKEFILTKDFDGFLKQIIQPSIHDGPYFSLSETILRLFTDWQTFKKVINTKDEGEFKYLSEFKAFFEKSEKNNHSGNIEFSFKVIPVKAS